MDRRIEEALRVKEQEYGGTHEVLFPRRRVFFFRDDDDSRAVEYCGRLKVGLMDGVEEVRLSEEADFERWLRRYIRKLRESEDSINHRAYLLFISSEGLRFDEEYLPAALDFFAELSYQFLYLGTSPPIGLKPKYFEACWSVHPMDILSGRILLEDAALSDGRITPRAWGFPQRGWYRLRTKRYSSIRDGICKALYDKLSPVFVRESTEQIEYAMKEFSYSLKGQREEIEEACPKAYELPLVGYQNLVGMLKVKKGFPVFGRERVYSDISIGKAAEVMFGKEGQEARVEWLRNKVVREYLPQVCEAYVRERREEIQARLLDLLSKRDIIERGALFAIRHAGELEKNCQEAEEALIVAMNKGYEPHSTGSKDMWLAMDPFFSAWGDYLRSFILKNWWKSIALFIEQYIRDEKEDYIRLGEAYREFGSCKDVDASSVILGTGRIGSVLDVCEAIKTASVAESYTRESLERLRRRTAKKYMETGDDLAEDRRPRIGILLSGGVLKEEERVYDEFEWRYHPRDYLPDNVVYELRMYNLA